MYSSEPVKVHYDCYLRFYPITIRLAKTSISDLMQILEVTRGFVKPVKN